MRILQNQDQNEYLCSDLLSHGNHNFLQNNDYVFQKGVYVVKIVVTCFKNGATLSK